MDEKCVIEGCPGTAKFSCSCDNSLLICQDHIAEHIRGFSFHEISESKKASNLIHQRTNQAIFSLSSLNSKALSEGKDMFKELYEKLCNIVDELSMRQQCLLDLSNLNYSEEVELKIQELEKLNITFRNKNDFRKLLDAFMSPEGEIFKSSNFEGLKKDFKCILDSLDKSNEVLKSVSDDFKNEQSQRKELESRIKILEQKSEKIDNLDQKLKIVESQAGAHLKIIEDFNKDLCKVNNKVEVSEKRFKEKFLEIQKIGKSQAIQFKALEIGIRKSTEDNIKSINENYTKIIDKVKDIEQVKDDCFKQKLEKFFEDINKTKITMELEERKKKEEEEDRRKKNQEEDTKIHHERSNSNSEKSISMNLKEKIDYFYPIITTYSSFYSLEHSYQSIKELLVSNDGKFLFICKSN